MFVINIYILAGNDSILRLSSKSDGSHSIREIVTQSIKNHNIDTKYGTIIIENAREELMKNSLVCFFNNESFDDFLDDSLIELTDYFAFQQLDLIVEIGGIGGEVGEEYGIHYMIKTRNEHPPAHVHCKMQKKHCKCMVESLEIVDPDNSNAVFFSKDKKRIREYVKRNRERITKEWERLNGRLR